MGKGEAWFWLSSQAKSPGNKCVVWADSRARMALVGQELLSPSQVTGANRVEGLIERVTYFNEDSGFCVLRVKASGHRDFVTVVGTLPSVSPGEWITGLCCNL